MGTSVEEPIMKDARQRTTTSGVSPCLWALLLLISSSLIHSGTGTPLTSGSSDQDSVESESSSLDYPSTNPESNVQLTMADIINQKLVPPREERRPISERDHYFRSMKRSGGDHYFRSLRDSPDHYFRSLRSPGDHYFRSLRSPGDHYFRSLRD